MMNPKKIEAAEQIRMRLQQAKRIAIFCHIRPDGDAIGSTLGLGTVLKNSGKEVQLISPDGVPSEFEFLFDIDGLDNDFASVAQPYDCSILLDISSLDRAGAYWEFEMKDKPDICIDHHISNPGIAKINCVDPQNPSTASLITELLPFLGLSLTTGAASALLTGVLTDTIGFSTTNVNPAVLRIAADLMDAGANLYYLNYKALREHSTAAARLWERALHKMQNRDGLVWTTLTAEDRKFASYDKDDDAEFVNFMSSLTEAYVAVLFVETGENDVKISWRAKPGFNVSDLACSFGGGGHVSASGASLNQPMDVAIDSVLQRTLEMIRSAQV